MTCVKNIFINQLYPYIYFDSGDGVIDKSFQFFNIKNIN